MPSRTGQELSRDPWLAVVLAVATVSVCGAVLLVHLVAPHAEGSGIPRADAVVQGNPEPGRPRILSVKYVRGMVAERSRGGLALDREGPSVEMVGIIGA